MDIRRPERVSPRYHDTDGCKETRIEFAQKKLRKFTCWLCLLVVQVFPIIWQTDVLNGTWVAILQQADLTAQ